MPLLRCQDGDLDGYGCISTQFANSLIDRLDEDATKGDSQWFSRITRFLYELELPSGKKVPEKAIRAAIENKQITECTLINVTYIADPKDATVVYVEGEIQLVADAGSPIPGNKYKFKHRLKQVWRITETKFS